MSDPKPFIVIHDALTGETVERELTQEELDALQTDSPTPSE